MLEQERITEIFFNLCKKRLTPLLLLWLIFLLINSHRLEAGESNLSSSPLPPLEYKDTTRRFNPALVLLLTDTSQLARELVRSRRFYGRLENLFSDTELTRRLFDLLFIEPRNTASPKKEESPEKDQYRGAKDKIIGDITIQKLDVFGPSLKDTAREAGNWFMETGNKLHTPTRNRVIRKTLLIEAGEQADPFTLAESERLLRELSFIRDAQIMLLPRKSNSDTIDVLVLTQDVFPYSVGGSLGGLDESSLVLNNYNLAGLGHVLSNEFIYDQDQKPVFGYKGLYEVENIRGLFINSRLSYSQTEEEKGVGGSLQRSFFSSRARWAGGLQLNRTTLKREVRYLLPEQDSLLQYRFHYANVWLAHAFRFKSAKATAIMRDQPSLILAARIARTNFRDRPAVSAEKQSYFHNRSFYLASVGWSSRHYFRDRYIYGFGRTEDVPYGHLINFTFGIEKGEFTNRPYTGLSLQRGRYIAGFGYLAGRVHLESFFRKNGNMEQRLLHFQSRYFSPLMSAGRYRLRQLLSFNYTYGDRRFAHEFLQVGDESIRGLYMGEKRGTQRLALHLETIAFTPFRFLGFQSAGFAFADLAYLNRHDHISLQGSHFAGLGLGLRIRNENLTFNTFQLRFSYYPDNAEQSFGFNLSAIPSLFFNDFSIEEPRPFQFR